MNIARLYLRVSTDEHDLTRQNEIEAKARAAGYYIAGIYREKASGARADRPELLRMISDLQPDEVVIAEKIDRISRLPLAEAEQLVASIRAKGARLAIPSLVDLSDLAQRQGVQLAKNAGKYAGRKPDEITHRRIISLRQANHTIEQTADLANCSKSQVKRVWATHLSSLKNL